MCEGILSLPLEGFPNRSSALCPKKPSLRLTLISCHGTKKSRLKIPNTRIMPIRKPDGHTLIFRILFILTPSPIEPDRRLRLKSSSSSRFGYLVIRRYQPEKIPKMIFTASHMSTKKTGNVQGKFCLVGLDTFDFGISKREIHRLPGGFETSVRDGIGRGGRTAIQRRGECLNRLDVVVAGNIFHVIVIGAFDPQVGLRFVRQFETKIF